MGIDLSKGVLLVYQKKWVADESQLMIGEKSRRTGLTWADAAKAALTTSKSKTALGCDHFYLGADKDMAKEYIDAVAMWSKAFSKACDDIEESVLVDDDRDITMYTVRYASGFKVHALSSAPRSLRGRQGNVTVDEAAFHDRLQEVIKAALAFTMWGGCVRIISTHNGDESFFNELLKDTRAGKKRWSIHRVTLDDACEGGLYKRICAVRNWEWSQAAEDEWKFNLINDAPTQEDGLEEYACVPKNGGGVYFSRVLIESRMEDVPVIELTGSDEFNAMPLVDRTTEIDQWCKETIKPLLEKLDPEEEHCLGEDFARSCDLTVLVPLAISKTLRRRAPFQVELRNMPFAQQREILWYILRGLPKLSGVAMDARGNGQQIAEETGDEFGDGIVEEVMLTQGWYLSNMPLLKAAFQDDMIAVARHDNTLTDFRAVQFVKGIPKVPEGNTSTDKKNKRHGDAAIAYALAWFASIMDTYIYSYEAVNTSDQEQEAPQISCTRGGFSRGRGIL